MTDDRLQMTNFRNLSVKRGGRSRFFICHLSFVILKEPKLVQWLRSIG
jgi:hypothetical protein